MRTRRKRWSVAAYLLNSLLALLALAKLRKKRQQKVERRERLSEVLARAELAGLERRCDELREMVR